MGRAFSYPGVVLLASVLSGCASTGAAPPIALAPADQAVTSTGAAPPIVVAPDDHAITPTVEEPDDVKYYRSDEPLRLAQEYFNRGIYGRAERYFQDAAEKAPKDPSAWIGLAASYDRLARFDLADRAYRHARALCGDTVQLLNNEGYSYMLRGNLAAAREKFTRAAEIEPDNPTVLNNIRLLNASYQFIQRDL